MCHKKERELLKENKRKEILRELEDVYHINIKHLSLKSAPVDKVLVYKKIRRTQQYKKSNRVQKIVKKILNEYEREKKMEDLKNKRYDAKIKQNEIILKDMEVVGTKIELVMYFLNLI